VYMNTLRELSLTELTVEQDAFNENGLWYVAIHKHEDVSTMLMSRIAR
jgi:hypothetical protein